MKLSENNQKKHILIVEDEEQTRFSLSIILKKAGYKVTTAADGLSAYDKIKNAKDGAMPIDFLLTDIQVPFLNGLELIKKLENEEMSLPTLVITGYGDKEMVVKLIRSGCEEYIDKPFDPNELLNRVDSVFTRIEKTVIERKKINFEIEKERTKLNQMLESYKLNFDLLRSQISTAVDAYQNLIQIESKGYNVHIACRYNHLMDLGGDFVGIHNSGNGNNILVADVAGHDIGASYHTIMIKAFFDENCRAGNDGQSFFKLLNKQLTENGKNDRMITANYLSIDLEKMRAEIIAAAHPSIIIINNDTEPRLLTAQGDVLGINEDVSFDTRSFDIKSGDRIFLYTDGLIDISQYDVVTGKKKKLLVEGLIGLIEKNRNKLLDDMVQAIWDESLDFCGQKLYDDILILGLEIP